MNDVVYGDYGSKSASAETGNRFNGEITVVCGLFRFAQTKIGTDTLKDRDRSSYVARGAIADLDDVFALGLKGEILIKGCNAVNSRFCHTKLGCKIGEDLLGELSVMLLDILENGDYRLLAAFVGGENLVHNAEIKGCFHFLLLYIGAKFLRKIYLGQK